MRILTFSGQEKQRQVSLLNFTLKTTSIFYQKLLQIPSTSISLKCKGTGDLGDIGMNNGKYYSVNVPLHDGMDDQNFIDIFKSTMQKVMEVFQPGAIILHQLEVAPSVQMHELPPEAFIPELDDSALNEDELSRNIIKNMAVNEMESPHYNISNIQAYYRRGMAYFALTKFTLAGRDFKKSILLSPTNHAARSRFEECKKNIKRLKFEAAISNVNIRASERLNIDDFFVGESYDGPCLDHDGKITESFIESMVVHFKNGKQIHKRFVAQILLRVKKIFEELPNICEVSIPNGCVLSEQIFIMHGGLFSDSEITIQRLNAMDRFKEPSDNGVFSEILWSDPCDSCGKFPNKRGVGIAFGPDITKNFLNKNGLKLVIRSHEVKDQGYEIQHGNNLITVFSAPNYWELSSD
ncbi:unnamed protein product [Bathycoccus prasinos]